MSTLNSPRWILDHDMNVEVWKQWADQTALEEPWHSNVDAWSYDQVSAMAEKIHHELIATSPDQDEYSQTRGVLDEIDAEIRAYTNDDVSFAEGCMLVHRFWVKRAVVNFTPQEFEGKPWSEVRRSKGPLKTW